MTGIYTRRADTRREDHHERSQIAISENGDKKGGDEKHYGTAKNFKRDGGE